MTARAGPSGVLVVDKDAGRTSFDVVALVRKALGVRRVGHAGTLDPAAVGVLPILIGEATKLMPYLADQDKEYRVTVRFGVRTDTLDLTGRVLSRAPRVDLEPGDLAGAVRAFVGTIRQLPPMYSAVHRGGRRLYELAREGLEVEREPRAVVVRSIEVVSLAVPAAVLRVVCGKGTYIRTLVADLGEALGCGAAVEHLARLRVGPFVLEDAVPVASLLGDTPAAVWSRIRPSETALAAWPWVRLDERGTRSFLNGQAAPVRSTPPDPARLVAVRGDDGRFLGVGALLAAGLVKPERILHADHPGPRPVRA